MIKHFLFTVTALITLGLAGNALAVETTTDVKPDQKVEMKAKDGKKFKKADHKKFHEEMFAKTDKNGDGVLSKEEFLESHRIRAEKAFDMLDADKDGSLTKDELKEGRKHWKNKMHRDPKGHDKKSDKAPRE